MPSLTYVAWLTARLNRRVTRAPLPPRWCSFPRLPAAVGRPHASPRAGNTHHTLRSAPLEGPTPRSHHGARPIRAPQVSEARPDEWQVGQRAPRAADPTVLETSNNQKPLTPRGGAPRQNWAPSASFLPTSGLRRCLRSFPRAQIRSQLAPTPHHPHRKHAPKWGAAPTKRGAASPLFVPLAEPPPSCV